MATYPVAIAFNAGLCMEWILQRERKMGLEIRQCLKIKLPVLGKESRNDKTRKRQLTALRILASDRILEEWVLGDYNTGDGKI